MRVTPVFCCVLLCASAHAQTLTAQCPNAEETLGSVTFPLDLPYEVTTGEATVTFTISTDGSIADAAARTSSDPAFAWPAVAAVKRLRCMPRETPGRFALPIAFVRPRSLTESLCPNFKSAMRDFDFPKGARDKGVNRGSAILEFTLQPSGVVTRPVVLWASREDFAKEGLRMLAALKCNPVETEQQVRVPMSFRID